MKTLIHNRYAVMAFAFAVCFAYWTNLPEPSKTVLYL